MNDTGVHTHFLIPTRASELVNMTPAPLEFIDGLDLFVKGELNYLMGAGAAGKTTLMVQLAAAVGLSERAHPGPALWLEKPVTTRGPVMFFSAEDDTNALHRKLLDVCAALAVGLEDLPNVILHDLAKEDDKVLLASAARGRPVRKTKLFDALENSVATIKPVLIIIDNRAQVVMADEIDRNVATAVGNKFRALAAKSGATVILLGHPSVAGMKTGSSGSTGWNNTVRNTVLMTKPEGDDEDHDAVVDDGKRQLIVPKSNYGPMGLRANLQWRAGVYCRTDKQERPDEGIGKDAKAELVFLQLLEVFESRGTKLSNSPNSSTYAPRLFAKDDRREGINKREFERAMNRLFDAGKLKTEVLYPGTQKEKQIIKAASND
ncbi:AAA family ATPase [Rhizobium leguminosarum]|uniref:AAA family ATPase n=1 Tax=Rhizobium leguminosarum TaxID=384 RepID=A0A6P0DNV6_RHILE|nr:AAA family ATPase [Rhizobium leguminosarum]NEK53231.1 AAA family ATPase [Rhizobium leguminosarum]